MKREIDLPDLPDGFEYTGEFRAPKKLEWIWSQYKERPAPVVVDYDSDPESDRRLIIERVIKTAPPLTQLDRIKAEYAEYDVVELEWDKRDRFLQLFRFNSLHLHTTAQSMKGFQRYVYDGGDGFTVMVDPVWCVHGVNFHPVAVLFTK